MKISSISMWRNGMILGFSFFLTVTLLSIGYAFIGSSWTPPSTLEVGASSILSAGAWNNLLANFNNLDARTTSLNSGAAKAWVNFNGSACSPNCTIRASYNISSVVRNSAGNYTINFTDPLADGNYAIVTSLADGNAGVSAINHTVQVDSSSIIPSSTGFRLQTGLNWYSSSSVMDEPYVYATIFR